MQIIQGSRTSNPGDGYFAFLSIEDLNVPLVPEHSFSNVEYGKFRISMPGRSFLLSLDPRTEPEIVNGVRQVLAWFTRADGQAEPTGASFSGMRPSQPHGVSAHSTHYSQYHGHGASDRPPAASPMSTSMDGFSDPAVLQRASTASPYASGNASVPQPSLTSHERARSSIDRAGVRGAELVTKYGGKLATHISTRMEARAAAASADGTPQRNVKVGGKATTATLGTARKAAGVGAGIAASVTETLSNKLGNHLANNRMANNMRSSPEGSTKRVVHDLLVSGGVAIGRVYVAADNQGKLLIEATSNGATKVTQAKYGDDAAQAARSIGGIASDGYRIIRFPNRLGATALLKSAMKGAAISRADTHYDPGAGAYDPGAYIPQPASGSRRAQTETHETAF